MISSGVGPAFHAAYELSPDWAIANLTTWLVWIGLLGAMANFAVVLTAFYLQDRQAKKDERVRDTHLANLHASALRAASNTLEIYDAVVGGKSGPRVDFSLSDVTGRMRTMQRFIDYYLNQNIVSPGIVDALITTLTLVDRTLLDLEQMPSEGQDRLPANMLAQLYAHRAPLRDGAKKILDLAWQLPAGNVAP